MDTITIPTKTYLALRNAAAHHSELLEQLHTDGYEPDAEGIQEDLDYAKFLTELLASNANTLGGL